MGAQLAFGGATPSAGLDLDNAAVRALFAECHNCEAVEAFPSNVGLPAGWVELADDRAANGKAALCPDCRSLAEPFDAAEPVATPAMVHCGFRLSHHLHLAAGFATLRLHGGARARSGADLPATFLVDRAGIRELIQGLETIDEQLAQGAK